MLQIGLIAGGVAGVIGLLIYTFGDIPSALMNKTLAKWQGRAERSHLPINTGLLLLASSTAMLLIAGLIIALTRLPLWINIAIVLVAIVIAFILTDMGLTMAEEQRQRAFSNQLEMVLRALAASLQAGLGLRQAIIEVAQDLDEPARYEFRRVIGRTNIGFSVLDALDELAERMPSAEMTLTAHVIRIQSQTGGDLGKLLSRVADTLRSRRTLVRKLRALTAEGRISAWIILALPIFIGAFIVIVQPKMGHALLFTSIGQWSLAIAVGLEAAALISLRKIMEFNP